MLNTIATRPARAYERPKRVVKTGRRPESRLVYMSLMVWPKISTSEREFDLRCLPVQAKVHLATISKRELRKITSEPCEVFEGIRVRKRIKALSQLGSSAEIYRIRVGLR
jgi:hypothetical protein